MKRPVLAVLLLFSAADALAEPPAVRTTNFELGFSTADTYISGDRDANTYRFDGRATFPIVSYFGAALTGVYSKSKVGQSFRSLSGSITTSTGGPPTSKVDNTSLALELFLRDPSLGRVGVTYGGGRIHTRGDAVFLDNGTNALDTRTYSAHAEYYFPRVTLGATRTRTHLDGGADLDTATAIGSWYALDDLRLSLSAAGLDLKDTYGVGVAYHPRTFIESLSFLLDYVQERQSVKTHFIMIGISYSFRARGDLITLDRSYR